MYLCSSIFLKDMDENLCNLLITKGELKQSIFSVTMDTMQLFKDAAKGFEEYYRDHYADDHDNIPVLFTNKNQYQFMLKFGGDVLIFLMHTNVFEFSRDHEVMRTPYIKEDKDRSYCGMIQIFNFLGDSLKYDRVNDLGYMIGRIFINKEGHYYIEGKRELAQVINNFSSNEISAEAVQEILSSAIRYTLNFDLLVPNYEDMKIITVNDILQLEEQTNLLRTGKRLGFRFEQDKNE